ncbi:GYD domain-containing protein [Nocardia sp. R16R-3T]
MDLQVLGGTSSPGVPVRVAVVRQWKGNFMRCFMIGKHQHAGLDQPDRRAELAMAKAAELGIQVLERCMTVGRYDFCSLLEVPDIAAATAFSHWYRRQGFADSELLVVLDGETTKRVRELSVADIA